VTYSKCRALWECRILCPIFEPPEVPCHPDTPPPPPVLLPHLPSMCNTVAAIKKSDSRTVSVATCWMKLIIIWNLSLRGTFLSVVLAHGPYFISHLSFVAPSRSHPVRWSSGFRTYMTAAHLGVANDSGAHLHHTSVCKHEILWPRTSFALDKLRKDCCFWFTSQPMKGAGTSNRCNGRSRQKVAIDGFS
jgi:hypothetical protein